MARPIRIAILGFAPIGDVRRVAEAVDAAATDENLDLVVLPETFRGDGHPEDLDGPSVTALGELARLHKTYIACSIDRMKGDHRWNSTVLLDRRGQIACIYDKANLFGEDEELSPPRQPGRGPMTYQADFGRIGFAICFDINFPDHWQELARQGAELVVFPSAYPAGRSLQAHAINHHYYIVSASQTGACLAFDITGDRLLDERSKTIRTSHITLDLDRCLFHLDCNQESRARLLDAHRGHLIDLPLDQEGWFVLQAAKPGVSARDLAARFGLEELRSYKQRIQATAGPPSVLIGS